MMASAFVENSLQGTKTASVLAHIPLQLPAKLLVVIVALRDEPVRSHRDSNWVLDQGEAAFQDFAILDEYRNVGIVCSLSKQPA